MTKIRSILTTLFILCSLTLLHAIPAKQTPITVTEPDGSTLTVYLHGDEYFSWRTTSNGTPIVLKDGYYHYALYQEDGKVSATSQRVMSSGRIATPKSVVAKQDMTTIARMATVAKRAQSKTATTKGGIPTTGTVKVAVILVEFQDLKFTTSNARQKFDDMLNKEGYSDNGATGSVRDYFEANSGGKYMGDFDVHGVYTLDHTCAYYGGNDANGSDVRPQQMIVDAVKKCYQDGVDFSQYDNNNDGVIDNVFVYFAGLNEAEGGAEDTVWPHQFAVYNNSTFNGKVIRGYACASELRWDGTVAGIGTFCHEFSHVLGLADHYDTNGSINGQSAGLGDYDIMSSGNYNNDGHTPPMMNALELETLGWCTPTVVDEVGEVTLDPLNYYGKKTLRINTEVEGEYFLAECRYKNGIVWDNYIPGEGLIIYHVDKSAPYIKAWEMNAPNGTAAHECLSYVVASNRSTSYFRFTWNQVPFPYSSRNEWSASTAPKAQSWGGVELNYQFDNITRTGDNNQQITLDVIGRDICSLSGLVADSNTGVGVANATVTLVSVVDNETYAALTSASGWYELDDLPNGNYTATITAEGYKKHSQMVVVTQGAICNFEMACKVNYLGYHNGNSAFGLTINGWHKVYITLDDTKLTGLEGNAITGINIYLASNFPGGEVSIKPSNGKEKSVVVNKTIPSNGWQLIDVSGFNLTVEKGVTYDVAIIGEASWAFIIDNDTSGENNGLSNMFLNDPYGKAYTLYDVSNGGCQGNIMIEMVVTDTSVEEDTSSTTIVTSTDTPQVAVSNGELRIAASSPISQLHVNNMQGGRVRHINQPANTIDLAGLAKGLYIVTLVDAEGVHTYKIVL